MLIKLLTFANQLKAIKDELKKLNLGKSTLIQLTRWDNET